MGNTPSVFRSTLQQFSDDIYIHIIFSSCNFEMVHDKIYLQFENMIWIYMLSENCRSVVLKTLGVFPTLDIYFSYSHSLGYVALAGYQSSHANVKPYERYRCVDVTLLKTSRQVFFNSTRQSVFCAR